jgi:hypothetical protein
VTPSDFVDLAGHRREFDLDSVYEVVRGYSKVRAGWTSIVVYEPTQKNFIEVRSSPQDFRGNSADEAEEVTVNYISDAYGMSEQDLDRVSQAPHL